MITLVPASIEEARDALAEATRNGHRVSIRGGDTKSAWGSPLGPVDVQLLTSRLNAVLAHRHGDLTATVQAGATLNHVNRVLARHQQWIPLDPPDPEHATIGGIVAVNDSGPRRHRYGAPRDLIIGVEIVLADGTAAKAGGIVVKNVAGYDLSRLMTGSFGSLAMIVSATFKLFPVPPASRTVVVDVGDATELAAMLTALNGSQLTPTAVEVQAPPGRMLIRFETVETAADEQAAATIAMAHAAKLTASIVQGDEEQELWDTHARRPWAHGGAVFKVTMLPTDVADTITAVGDAAGAIDHEIVGRAGVGVLLVRVGADAPVQARVLNTLRERLPSGRGSAVVVRGSEGLRALVDPWGPMGDALPLMRAIKQQFDPKGILNPSRGPGGL